MQLKNRKTNKELYQKWSPVILIIVLWAVITQLGLVRPLFIPGPADIIRSILDTRVLIIKSIAYSFSMIILGFTLGSAAGIIVGLLMAYSRVFLNVLNGIIGFIRPIPIFALIPLFLLWFGVGRAPQIALIIFGCFVILVVNTMEAIRNIPSKYEKAGLTLGAKRLDVFKTIIIPLIIPNLIGSVRVAAAASFGLDVAAEFMGTQSGLGYLMIIHTKYLRTEGIIAIIIIFSILAFLLDRVLMLVESRLTQWTERRVESLVTAL